MGRRRSPVKQTNRHVTSWSLFQATFSPSPVLFMAKKKRVVKKVSKRVSKSRKSTYLGRGPSGKPKHSKVAKMIKLAKMRARKGKVRKVVKGKKKRKRR